jgi:hypothetical protein
MGFDQKGNVVLRVAPGADGRWDVNENEFEDPLATFDSRQEACDYANKMTMGKEGATVVVLEAQLRTSTQRRRLHCINVRNRNPSRTANRP